MLYSQKYVKHFTKVLQTALTAIVTEMYNSVAKLAVLVILAEMEKLKWKHAKPSYI